MILWPSIFLSHVLACMGRDSISVTRLRNPWDVGKSNENEIAIAYIYHHKTKKSQPKYQNTEWNCLDRNLINGLFWTFEPSPIFIFFRCRLVWKKRKVHENRIKSTWIGGGPEIWLNSTTKIYKDHFQYRDWHPRMT